VFYCWAAALVLRGDFLIQIVITMTRQERIVICMNIVYIPKRVCSSSIASNLISPTSSVSCIRDSVASSVTHSKMRVMARRDAAINGSIHHRAWPITGQRTRIALETCESNSIRFGMPNA
jgi:hypothetical protein